jgi:hypothetical protein
MKHLATAAMWIATAVMFVGFVLLRDDTDRRSYMLDCFKAGGTVNWQNVCTAIRDMPK